LEELNSIALEKSMLIEQSDNNGTTKETKVLDKKKSRKQPKKIIDLLISI
jgi:hypothetical protein